MAAKSPGDNHRPSTGGGGGGNGTTLPNTEPLPLILLVVGRERQH